MASPNSDQTNHNFAFDALQSIRNRLLDLTGRNRLLNFRHGKSGFIRVIDEMPDQLAQEILDGYEFTYIPIEEPRREELIKNGYIEIDEKGNDVKAKSNPTAKDWAKIKGFNTNYELPESLQSSDLKHNDKNIQSLLYPRELEAQLRNIRSKANIAIEETGANILYLAFGFLEWFEDEKSDAARQAPLYLIPVKIDRASLNKDLGTYTYIIEYTGEDIISNLSLREKLKHDFHLELPELREEMLPEEYFKLVENQLIRHKPDWKVKRFATLAMFDFGKLLMYLDLDPSRWPQGDNNIQNHAILQQFFAKEGVEDEPGTGTSFGQEYPIDTLVDVHNLYPLIDDADSSQHSALVDAIKGKNLVIEGPPGSGKSQTITNIIAAAISQGKKVLFVAEKMAALQVVKSRLTRAGLGDFCLELHSHKTQKKQVYENIAQRINKQNEYRYPSSIEIDIQMYEEKKEALTAYADLINSQWKNTGRTIHQIFSTAARYREEFSNIPLADIKPEHINGQSFDEISARRTTDDLKKYSDVFEEVKKQLGMTAELSDHPWFGVYNKSIQLFDGDHICQLLDQWNITINDLISSLKPLNDQLCDNGIDEINSLKSILNSQKNIPELKGSEYFPALKSINTENKHKLFEYLEQYQSNSQLFSDLNQDFEKAVLLEGDSYKTLIKSTQNLHRECKNSELSLTNIYQQLQLLILLRDVINSISEDLNTLITHDNSLATLLSTSFNGFTEFKLYLDHINGLNPLLVLRRHDLFDNDLLDQYIPTLEELLPKIQPLHKELSEYFNLDNLPSVSELKEINEIISHAGFFCWLISDWRTAKAKLLANAKGLKPKLNTLTPMISKLITFKELSDLLVNEPAYQSLLQHEYKGINTQIDEIANLRNWYKNIRSSYGIGFGKRVAFASSLLSLGHETFKGLKHLSESKSYSEHEQFFNLYSQLEQVFNHDIFNNKDTDLKLRAGVSDFIEQLQDDVKNIQSACKHEVTIRELSKGIVKISDFFKADNILNNNIISTSIFGENTKLDVRVNSDQTFTKIKTTLELSIAIDDLELEPLKNYLLNNINTENRDLLITNLNALSAKFNDYESAAQVFSERVQLDEGAWFKGLEGKLESYLAKNTKALIQPRWLSTWVDFIRIRTSLSEKGLENLLRYTETGALDLDDIEQIYTYSVFDILSREIINENQTLAYFSGAEQNATRKQFREYDIKLKSLQQEKIAYQVADHGFKNTCPGSARGKVGSYTEMGLITHQINLKTRHAPIRQLVRKAGESLLALKPCFMMGPHSVAQYLAPGQLEFDIVVMDEASQIKPQDALGTIARGKQLVVVGDPKQLPPTSFFDKAVENDDDDTTAIEQSESILDVSLPMFNARRLRWHYRSRHESLIAFSNQAFYESNLIVFPSPSSKSDEFGIKFTHVKSGRFVNQHNIEEAKVIAQSVRNHILHRPDETLGVVAMSSKQREQIERCIEELSKDDAIFRNALADNAHKDEALFLKNLENVQGDERDVIFISCTYGPQEAGAAQMPQRFGPINSAAGGRRLNVLFTRSKKRMHVFSSMTEGHILATENSSPGVHALKRFLAYAQTGKLQQVRHTGKQPDSDFEISVMNALKLEGFNCVPQVGIAGYFIDLAVQDPEQPGRYLMGVECDGATYHSAKSARDRDRLRQSVLEGLGWNIKRIWSTDWFKNPQAQLKPIIELLHQLKTEASYEPIIETEIEEIVLVIEHEEKEINSLNGFSNTGDSLEEKLHKFDQLVIAKSGSLVPIANKLLRPAMIDALCEYKPISKNEFLEVIPSYLRTATDTKQGEYLDQVLNIIAEDEKEFSLDSSCFYESSCDSDIEINNIEANDFDSLATFRMPYDTEEESTNITHAIWIKANEKISIQEVEITGGNFYFGGKLDTIYGYGTEASLVDDTLSIEKEKFNFKDESLGYWPTYISLSPKGRGAYLDWLASDRNAADVPIGYVFIYFYGIERRILVDSINGEVDSEEFISLFKEVKRLKQAYGYSGSVSGYMQQFLELMCLLQPDCVRLENGEHSHNSHSLLFKHRLATIVNSGEPIPKDLALAWVRCNQFYNLKTAARRCESEFVQLFEVRYSQKYKSGIVVKPNKTPLRIDYRPASSSLRGFNLTQEVLPDPSILKAPLNELIAIADVCTEELDAYSRYLGKKETSREDVAALLLLPDDVSSPENLNVIEKFTEWANHEIDNNKGLVAVSDFWQHMGTPLPSKLNKNELELITNLVNKAGYGIAPDNRYHHVKPQIDGNLVIFNGGHGHFFEPSATFNEVGMVLKLGSMVAAIDSHVDDSELAILENLIDHDIKLSAVEKQSLHAYLTWQLSTSANMTGIKIRLEQLGDEAKNVVSHILLSIALADGKIDPNEIKQLEKIYSALGIDRSKVSSDIHIFSSTKETSIIQRGKAAKAQEITSGFTLNDEILALHESETKDVQNMLSSIFIDDGIDDQMISNTADIQRDSTGLDTAHKSLFDTLLTREKWLREEVEELCKKFGLMLDGAIETINDWSFDLVDAPVIDEYGDVYIDQEIVEELKE